jgi:hypothetical protein
VSWRAAAVRTPTIEYHDHYDHNGTFVSDHSFVDYCDGVKRDGGICPQIEELRASPNGNSGGGSCLDPFVTAHAKNPRDTLCWAREQNMSSWSPSVW